MHTQDLQKEISSLEIEVIELEKDLDKALMDDRELNETKKIFHQIKILREKLNELVIKNTDDGL